MRFIHSADWQIGMKASHAGEAAQSVRDARLEAAKNVVDLVRETGADFLLLAGDTFEDNACDRRLVQQTADILRQCDVPTYIIPGNHDPIIPGSVWEHPAWDACPRVHVVKENAVIDVPGGRLYACPLTEKHGMADPTRWIDAHDDSNGDLIAIGLAHGNVEGVQRDELEFPIARDAAARVGLDYLALGHWHSTVIYDGVDGHAGQIAYSGAHETTKFGEPNSGNALQVDISRRGAAPEIQAIRTGVLSWERWDEQVHDSDGLDGIIRRLETHASRDVTLLELTLEGLLRPDDLPKVARIEELADGRFLHARTDCTRLLPESSDDAWLQALPAGPLRMAAERLTAWSAGESYDGETCPQDADVATESLRLLYRLVTKA